VVGGRIVDDHVGNPRRDQHGRDADAEAVEFLVGVGPGGGVVGARHVERSRNVVEKTTIFVISNNENAVVHLGGSKNRFIKILDISFSFPRRVIRVEVL